MTLREARGSAETFYMVFGGVAAFFVLAALVLTGAAVHDFLQRGEVPKPAFIAVPTLFVAALAFGLPALPEHKRARSLARMEERGIIAWATLNEIRETNHKINLKRLYRFVVTVAPPHAPPYAAEALWFFPMELRSAAAPGTRLVVCIDPDDPAEVIVDWDRTRASWTAPPR
jgi:hypothetical protein